MAKTKQVSNTPMVDTPRTVTNGKSRLEKFVEEERRMVKGRFRCFETPGGGTRVMVKKYKELPMFDRHMIDNEVYEVPLYVARHLNGVDVTAHAINGKVGSCSYGVHGFKMSNPNDLKPSMEGFGPNGEGGVPAPFTEVQKRVRRYGFESLEFDTDV